MQTTEIPPRSPVPPAALRPDGGDLYDARRWESAYRELHASPALIVQLQDELSYSRQREAFWISVVVHLVAIILIVNSQKLERFLPKRPVIVVSPNDWLKQKDLTYLELPPDEQKVSKRPNTDKISDKDRIATSRSPQLDPQELKKILDSARPGRPGVQGRPQGQNTAARHSRFAAAPAKDAGRVRATQAAARSEPGGEDAATAPAKTAAELQYRATFRGVGD